MDVVIVESPAKAKTIEKYLGGGYVVLASYGHVRDLLPKDGSVLPEKDFAMIWQEHGDANARKHFSIIEKAVKRARRLILATDPDREGEAIAWHVLEMLKKKQALKETEVERISFNAITRASVQDAMRHPRALDQELVDAYLARRALDYLVGFTLSPVLWRKLPGAKSAGRVQSVALRLVCERELEIESFQSREYWSIETKLSGADNGAIFPAAAVHWRGEKLSKFSLPDKQTAENLRSDIETAQSFRVCALESRETQRNPAPPFITSSLQQEASRKFGFSTDRTMRIAQRLYEGVSLGTAETQGLITYMRTDGVQMAPEAIGAVRRIIGEHFSANYLPEKPRAYKSKAKNAQEAHEAIRPVDPSRHPDEMRKYLSEEEAKLYDLIWKRALASQMASARLRQTRVDIDVDENKAGLRANGSVLLFDGFLRLYREAQDGEEKTKSGENESLLPPLAEGDALKLRHVEAIQHFTEPPPRFTESSLVKKLEELGIGRPSTYAATLSVLRERGYVRLDKRSLIPDDRGRLVTAFLAHFFSRYLDYDFTAQLEESLDSVSAGKLDWRRLLGDFWRDFLAAVEETNGLRISDVLEHLNEALAPYLFPRKQEGEETQPAGDPRSCPKCGDGILSIKLGRYGAFIGCSCYPQCNHTRPLNPAENDSKPQQEEDAVLGTDPQSGLEILRRNGRFGPYLQMGNSTEKETFKRVSIPQSMDGPNLSIQRAIALLALPRQVGAHPQSGEMVLAGIGRYGPYLRHQGKYINLESAEDVFEIGLNRAVELLAQPKQPRQRQAATPLRDLGAHPVDGETVSILDGRYGPYVKHGKTNATLPKGREVDSLTLEEALELLAAKARKPRAVARTKAKKKAAAKAKTSVSAKKKAARQS